MSRRIDILRVLDQDESEDFFMGAGDFSIIPSKKTKQVTIGKVVDKIVGKITPSRQVSYKISYE